MLAEVLERILKYLVPVKLYRGKLPTAHREYDPSLNVNIVFFEHLIQLIERY